MTSDEKLMLKIYEFAIKKGDPYKPVNTRQVANAVGLKETALKTIVKSLAQANLIKKIDDTLVCLTPRGCDFVSDMI